MLTSGSDLRKKGIRSFQKFQILACTHVGGIQLTALECRELKMTSRITRAKDGENMFLQHKALICTDLQHLATQKTYTQKKKNAREAQSEIRQGSCGKAVGSDFNGARKTIVLDDQVCKSCVLTASAPFSLSISLLSTYGSFGVSECPGFVGPICRRRESQRPNMTQCKHEKHVPNNFTCALADVILCYDASEGNAHCSCCTGLCP